MKLNTGTRASSSTRTCSSKRTGEYGLNAGICTLNSAKNGYTDVKLRRKSSSPDLRAPSSSIDTQRFIANGFDVNERISAMTSLIASGARLSAPNDPSPPKFETAAVNLCEGSPPKGP